MRVSRGFVAALAGLAVTIYGWFSPWPWPAWPGIVTLRLVFGDGFGDLSFHARAAAITALIAINVTFWAIVVYLLIRLAAHIFYTTSS